MHHLSMKALILGGEKDFKKYYFPNFPHFRIKFPPPRNGILVKYLPVYTWRYCNEILVRNLLISFEAARRDPKHLQLKPLGFKNYFIAYWL